jgi:putative membrane protein
MMFWWGPGMNGWGYALMSVSMVLFWGVVILGIVALVRYLGRSSQSAPDAGAARPSAEQVLVERFARGEIDEPEYASRLAALRDRQQSRSGL